GIATLVAGRVQLADHGRDVGLEQAVARDHRGQAELEDGFVRVGDHEQARGHDDRAQQDRALVSQHLVGDVAAEDRRGVDQREVGAIDAIGGGFAGAGTVVELGHDVEHQGPADAVEGEPLPELGHEQHPQGTRVAHDLLELRNRRFVGARADGSAHAVSPVDWTAGACPTDAATSNAQTRGAAHNQGLAGPEYAPPGPIEVRTSNSSGKNVRSSACFRKPTPDEPPVPRRKPMMRITVRMWRKRQSWNWVSRSTRSSHRWYSAQYDAVSS